MFAKRFFYVCAGIFLLALAYHLGATSATAQVGVSNPVVGIDYQGGTQHMVVTANGDAFLTSDYGTTWTLRGNVFGIGPTPTQQSSFGALKARYR